MVVDSLRLGRLDVPDDKIITMEKPVLGFEGLKRYCLVEIDEMRPFLWMQAVDEPDVTFLVVNPLVFFPGYKIEVNSKEIADLDVASVSSVETYVVVTVPDDPDKISVNLQAPILINTENNRAKQSVLVNSRYRVRHRIMDSLSAEACESPGYEKEPVGV